MKKSVGSTLIGLLVVIAIIGIGIALYFGGGLNGLLPGSGLAPAPEGMERSTTSSTPIGSTLRQTRGVECRERLSQLRQALLLRQTEEERITRLSELGLPARMLECPATHQPYSFNPETQTITCPTEGHTSF
jgi:hypothetical protein